MTKNTDTNEVTFEDIAAFQAASYGPAPAWYRRFAEEQQRRLNRAHEAVLEDARKYHPEHIDPETGELDYFRGWKG